MSYSPSIIVRGRDVSLNRRDEKGAVDVMRNLPDAVAAWRQFANLVSATNVIVADSPSSRQSRLTHN